MEKVLEVVATFLKLLIQINTKVLDKLSFYDFKLQKNLEKLIFKILTFKNLKAIYSSQLYFVTATRAKNNLHWMNIRTFVYGEK